MAYTQVVSVLLSWIGATIRRQSQASPARSQRAQPSPATQCKGHIMAAQVPAYMSPPAMKVSDKGMSCSSTNDHTHSPNTWHVEPKLTGLVQVPQIMERISPLTGLTISLHLNISEGQSILLRHQYQTKGGYTSPQSLQSTIPAHV
jgi:hypothetical protein